MAGGVALTALVGGVSMVATLLAPVAAVVGSVFTMLSGGVMVLASVAGLIGTVVVGSFMALGSALTSIVVMSGAVVSGFVAIIPLLAAVGSKIFAIGGAIAALAMAKPLIVAAAALAAIAGGTVAIPGMFDIAGFAVKKFCGLLAGIPGIFVQIAKAAKSAFGQTINEVKTVGDHMLTVFQSIKNKAVELFGSLKNTADSIWKALSLGDMELTWEAVWAHLDKWIAIGKQLFENIYIELNGLFQRLAAIVKLTFSNIVTGIRKEFNSILRQMQGTMAGQALGLGNIKIEEFDLEKVQKQIKRWESNAKYARASIEKYEAIKKPRFDQKKGARASYEALANAEKELESLRKREQELLQPQRDYENAIAQIPTANWDILTDLAKGKEGDRVDVVDAKIADAIAEAAMPKMSELGDMFSTVKERALEEIKPLAPEDAFQTNWTETMKKITSPLSSWNAPAASFKDFLVDIRDSAKDYLPEKEAKYLKKKLAWLTPEEALHPQLLTVGAFTGSKGTFSGLEARAGGFRTIEGKFDDMLDVLEQIERNTGEEEEWT